MEFNYLIRISKYENERRYKKNIKYINNTINQLVKYIDRQIQENPDINIIDINNNINGLVQSYLADISETRIRNKIIEHYLGMNMYSKNMNVRAIYDKLYRDDLAGKISIKDFEETRYSFNMCENMEKMVMMIMKNIRNQREQLNQIQDIDILMDTLRHKTSKERTSYIKEIAKEQNLSEKERKELIQEIEEGYKLFYKDEKEFVEEIITEHTQTARAEVKDDCIKCISKSIDFLDKFGFLEQYINLNNMGYKKIYINNANLTYSQVKEMLNEENLKKLSIEELVIMSSFWTNRVNKVIKDLNAALYIINREELFKEQSDENKTAYCVMEKDIKNIELKMNVIHKLYFELFSQLESSKSYKPVMKIKRYVNGIAKKHQEQYKQYFDRLFPNSKNSLKEDMILSNVFENARYNSYKIKSLHMQALLIALFNSNSKNIENYGYIKEPGDKKEIAIGVDIKGFNMPYALHISKDEVIEFLNQVQGNALFPIYQCGEDFDIRKEERLNAQILAPLTKEADEAIKQATERLIPRDRYAKTVRHINYLRKEGKMPEHMMVCKQSKKGNKYVFEREYIDLESGEKMENEKSKD